jgi:hypothetical protein
MSVKKYCTVKARHCKDPPNQSNSAKSAAHPIRMLERGNFSVRVVVLSRIYTKSGLILLEEA